MLRHFFISSQTFKDNTVLRAYIISEALVWSAWNSVVPLFAVYITTKTTGGNIESAGIAYSLYLLARVVFELLSGRLLLNSSDRKKFALSVIGTILMSLAYLGFVFSINIWLIFIFYTLLGSGMGIAGPAKNTLFSTHLDKNKEANEWATYDAITFLCMAIASAVGGTIVKVFGFSALFTIAAVLNLIGIVPYIYKRKVLSYL